MPNFSFCRSLRSCAMDVLYHAGASPLEQVGSEPNSSNHHPERRGQHVDRPALTRQHLTPRTGEAKRHPPNCLPLRQRVPCVRAIIKRCQIPDQPQSPNRPPPHILDQSIIRDRVGRDHHCATRKLTVVECQKQTASRIKLSLFVEPHRKRPPIKPRQSKKNRQQIPELPKTLKPPVSQ